MKRAYLQVKFDCDSPEPLRRNEGITCPPTEVLTEPLAHLPTPLGWCLLNKVKI